MRNSIFKRTESVTLLGVDGVDGIPALGAGLTGGLGVSMFGG